MGIGRIQVICGPMSSGKSDELIRRLRRHKIAGKSIAVFKSVKDTRDGMQVKSKDEAVYEAAAFPLKKAEDTITLFDGLDIKPDVIAIDEAQFLDSEIVNVVRFLADMGIDIIIAGLDKNFRAEPFGPMPQLLAISDDVSKLNAICMRCKLENATYTYRKTSDTQEILAGGNDIYEARCGTCWSE